MQVASEARAYNEHSGYEAVAAGSGSWAHSVARALAEGEGSEASAVDLLTSDDALRPDDFGATAPAEGVPSEARGGPREQAHHDQLAGARRTSKLA